MAPFSPTDVLGHLSRRQSPGSIVAGLNITQKVDWRASASREDLVVESWSQGLIVGALLVMACITIANMRRKVLLHKLILAELLLAMSHGTFCFMDFNGYGWYLSSTAALLYCSWIIHNVVAWMKVRPFFTTPGGFFKPKVGLWVKRVYLGTLALTVPVILFQVSDNFRFFNNRGGWYKSVRPYEPLFRDPWWVFTCIALFHVVRKCYGTGVLGLVKRSPRFGILLTAIGLSITFTILDIIASIHEFTGTTDGINPWWKLSLVFKCLTDTIMLDDFKTELKRLGIKRIAKEEAKRNSVALVADYPAGLDGPDMDELSPRRGTLFPYNPARSKTFNYDSDLDGVLHSQDLVREVNPTPSPPSSSVTERNIAEKKAGTNDPDADMEELEFATAFHLDPSRVSGAGSVNAGQRQGQGRPGCEREDHRSTTKKIGRLPGLKEFRFEAIKPGKLTHGHKHKRRIEEDEEKGPTDCDGTPRQTSGPSLNDMAGDDSGDEETRRLRRFRASIGAASSDQDSPG